MPAVDPPNLDPRDEDEVVADAVANLPAELTDRNSASDAVKLLEACGTFYGALLFYLNRIPDRLYQTLLNLVGIERRDAESATVELEFSAASGQAPTVPAGTVVKTGSGADAITFTTDTEITVPTGGTETVEAEAQVLGAAGNVASGELTNLQQPISGVDAVTNPAAASGGQDEEPIDALLERAPKEFRRVDAIITHEDFVLAAEGVGGVERALSIADQNGNGAVTIHILDTDLNDQGVNTTLKSDVEDEIEGNTLPGTVVLPDQKSIRVIQVTDVEITYESGADPSDTDNRIESKLKSYLTVVDQYGSAGQLESRGWEWGAKLYEHELISLIDRVDGVERVGTIRYQVSDDYGNNWSSEAALNGSIAPGWGGNDDTNRGLFHWAGSEYPGHLGFKVTAL